MPRKPSREAIEAIQQVQSFNTCSHSRTPVPDDVTLRLFREFTAAYDAVSPLGRFHVRHVLDWAVRFCSSQDPPVDLPPPMRNTYVLGRLMRAHQDELGIQEVGSYANRTVYAVTRSE